MVENCAAATTDDSPLAEGVKAGAELVCLASLVHAVTSASGTARQSRLETRRRRTGHHFLASNGEHVPKRRDDLPHSKPKSITVGKGTQGSTELCADTFFGIPHYWDEPRGNAAAPTVRPVGATCSWIGHHER
jgi:hypothetical protein